MNTNNNRYIKQIVFANGPEAVVPVADACLDHDRLGEFNMSYFTKNEV